MTREWYFQTMGQEIGPLTAAELKSKVATGLIQPDTLIRRGTDGKWMFAGKVKGLFPEPEPPPAPIEPPPAPKPNLTPTIPLAGDSRPSADLPTKSTSNPTSIVPAAYITLAEDETSSDPPSVEFYNFVGFREAISPVLHDAVKQFISNRGITISQLNRLCTCGIYPTSRTCQRSCDHRDCRVTATGQREIESRWKPSVIGT